MVRRSCLVQALALALIGGAGPALAEPDWRAAGGALFVGTALPDASEASIADDPPLPPLDQPFAAIIEQAAARRGLDPKLLHALVTVESAYQPTAVSRAGAAGLTQLMPAAARDLGVGDRFDPAANLSGGADYLARQIRRFGDLRLALAAYNAGPERVARLGRVPDIAETKVYVEAVVECYLALSAGRGVRSAKECRRGAPS